MRLATFLLFVIFASSEQLPTDARELGTENSFHRAIQYRCKYLSELGISRWPCSSAFTAAKSHSERSGVDTAVLPDIPRLTQHNFHAPKHWAFSHGFRPYIISSGSTHEQKLPLDPATMQRVMMGSDHKAYSVLDSIDELADSAPQYEEQQHPSDYVKQQFVLLAENCSRVSEAQYMSTSLGRRLMRMLYSLVPQGIVEHRFESHDAWLEHFFGLLPRVQEGFEAGTPWQILLMGCRGRGSEIHSDETPTAAWQVQLQGSKAWIICPPLAKGAAPWYESAGATDDVFAWRRAETWDAMQSHGCAYGVVHAGEAVYYPPKWLHATLNVSPWSVGISLHQLSVPEVHSLVGYLSAKVATFEAAGDDFASTDIDFIPMTATARAALPQLFDWWLDGVAGQWLHRPLLGETCRSSDALQVQAHMQKLANKNMELDGAELALL